MPSAFEPCNITLYQIILDYHNAQQQFYLCTSGIFPGDDCFQHVSLNRFHQQDLLCSQYMCVLFHYKIKGLMCLCLSAFSFSSIRIEFTGKSDGKEGAGLSHKHSAVVACWINRARLTFLLVKYPVHVADCPLLSHGVKLSASPFVLLQGNKGLKVF